MTNMNWCFPFLLLYWFLIGCNSQSRVNGPDPFVTDRFIDLDTLWLSGTAEIFIEENTPRRSVVIYQSRGREAARLALKESFLEICRTDQERNGFTNVNESQDAKVESRSALKLRILKEIMETKDLKYRFTNESDSSYPISCSVTVNFSKKGIKNFCLYNE